MIHPQIENYLGDGVYAKSLGLAIQLDLRAQDDYTRIVLEPDVFDKLVLFRHRMDEAFDQQLKLEREKHHD